MNELAPGTFYGETESFAIADAILSEVRHAKPRVMPEHVHEMPHFALLLAGDYEEIAHGERIVYAPQTIVFRPAHASHRDTVGNRGVTYFMIELGSRWQAEIAAQADPLERISDTTGGDTVWLATRLYALFRERDPESTLAAESLLFELCGHVDRMRVDLSLEPAWCKRTADRIARDFTARIDLATLAADAGVHPSHLTRVYRHFRQRTIGDDVAALRIQLACRLLATGSRIPLTEIAGACGFADQSHLTRTFTALTGSTPGRYRQSLTLTSDRPWSNSETEANRS